MAAHKSEALVKNLLLASSGPRNAHRLTQKPDIHTQKLKIMKKGFRVADRGGLTASAQV